MNMDQDDINHKLTLQTLVQVYQQSLGKEQCQNFKPLYEPLMKLLLLLLMKLFQERVRMYASPWRAAAARR